MKPFMKLLLLTCAVFICASLLTTCNRDQQAGRTAMNSYTHLAEKFKAEKQALSFKYQSEINRLSEKNNELREETEKSKHSLSAYRFKSKALEAQLNEAIVSGDTVKITALSESYFESRIDTDSACDSTISNLENVVANRDSVIVIQDKSLENLRELQEQQEIQTRLLTEELNTAYKVQKRRQFKTRVAAFGTMFVAGVISAAVIKQKLK